MIKEKHIPLLFSYQTGGISTIDARNTLAAKQKKTDIRDNE